MEIEVNGTRLWFDIDGPALVPDGTAMRMRPTVVLIHGGPGSFDHSYFKPDFAHLKAVAQVVYLDLRGHGRSARTPVDDWSFEACADDVRAFCDALGIARPVVFGHSMGGFIAMLYGARHPGHPGGLILQSTMARFDLERLVDGFRHFGGDEIAELARRDYGGEPISDAEWDRVFATFGPRVPNPDQLARRIKNVELGRRGMDLMHRFDVVGELRRIENPTLVCVGELDPVTPVGAAREIVAALSANVGLLEVIERMGHFPWLDDPDRYWPVIETFIAERQPRPAVKMEGSGASRRH
jgi:pimeloyl-ACP methyl ester carboxylesterase